MTFRNLISVSPKRALAGLVSLSLVLAGGAACNDSTELTGVDTNRVYTQIERLGNPLVSEVFFPKRDHGLDNNKNPSDDALTMDNGGTDVPGHIRSFVSQFPNRTEKTITTLQAVLSPDMLMVYPNRAGTAAGWLTWALQPGVGYGGRKLTDDVVDVGLTAIFSSFLNPTNAYCAPFQLPLCTDNVGANDVAFSPTFPYLAAPHL